MQSESSTPEHAWLQSMVGEWVTVTSENAEGPQQGEWVEIVRPIGETWIVAEGSGEMPDGVSGTTILTLGFDPLKNHFVGSWIGSMMTHHWTYEGDLDEARKVLTLRTEGPDFDNPGRTRLYTDVIDLLDDDNRTLTGSKRLDDGSWEQMMSVAYRRRK